MTRKKVISIGSRDKTELLTELSTAGIELGEGKLHEVMGTYHWLGTFDAADDRWFRLKELEEARGRSPLVTERIEYTTEEVITADLLLLRMHGSVTSKGETGPDDGNEYDYSEACPVCLSGARLIPPFRIRASDLPKKRPVAETHRRELLVSGDVADAMGEIGGSEQWLVPVEDTRLGRKLPWLAIQPRATMPRLHPSTVGLQHQIGPRPSDTCPRCGRDCYAVSMASGFELAYSRSAITQTCGQWIPAGEVVPDAAGTWELMGPGTRPGVSIKRQVAQPYIMVSQRVARALLGSAAKWAGLTPVTLLP